MPETVVRSNFGFTEEDSLLNLLRFKMIQMAHFQMEFRTLCCLKWEITSKAVIENSADLGIAWDGDFDRCFF